MAPLIATMPALPLISAYTVEWVAIDPTSGADVAGVTIQNPALYGIDLTGDVVNAVLGIEPRAIVGVPIVAALLVFLASRPVTAYFRTTLAARPSTRQG